MLDDIRIATPCNADWAEMTGDERSRFCGSCEKNVYDVSAMTRAEAEALIRAKEGDVCVRLRRRKDGRLITADCPVGVRRERLRARVWSTVTRAVAGLSMLWAFRVSADQSADSKKPPEASASADKSSEPKPKSKKKGKKPPVDDEATMGLPKYF